MTHIRDAYAAAIAKAFEESGHPYSYYLIQIAADVAMKTVEREGDRRASRVRNDLVNAVANQSGATDPGSKSPKTKKPSA